MTRLQRWSGNLPIRRKFQVLGLGLTLPFLLLFLLALLTYQSVTAEVSKTLELGRKGDEALVNGSKIDFLLLVQSTLQMLSIQAADPPGGVADPTVFEEAGRWFDLAEKEWQALGAAAHPSVRSTWNEFQTGLMQTLPALLADRLATRQKYDEEFQKLEGLTEHYQARLAVLAPPGLLLVQTQAIYAIHAVLQTRSEPYLQERTVSEWKSRRDAWKSRLPSAGTYRSLVLEYLAVIDAEMVPTLESWIAERGRIDFLMLKYHHEQTERIRMVATHFTEEKTMFLEVIRSGLAERMVSQSSLRNQSLAWLIGLVLLGFIGGLLLFWLLKLFERGLVDPLTEATQWAIRIQNGDYAAQLQSSRTDEVGVLSITLEQMAREVIQKTRESELANRNLEATVEQRTEHLALALEDLKEAQAKIVSSEKLTLLGTMAAGMAHELNTPLAAVISADRSILDFLQTKMESARTLYESLSPEEQEALAVWTAHGSNRPAGVLPKHRRKELKALSQKLSERGIPDPSTQAELWIELGLGNADDLHRQWAQSPRVVGILGLAIEFSNVPLMAKIILAAAEQAAGVVHSLRQYISDEAHEESRWFPLKSTLETVLQLIGHRRLHEVDLVWDLQASLRVWGPQGVLTQIWINLITNALQAMQFRGPLVLEARETPDQWTVGIRDHGPGIPPEVGDRIFEPFYTTKKDWGGMGLGLDICRRLVDTLGGELTYQSQPGETVFEVRWPRPPSDSPSP